MNVFEKLIRFLQDDYKVGVESTTVKPVIYIDPRKFDTWALERANEQYEKTRKRLKESRDEAELKPEPEKTKLLERISKREDQAKERFIEIVADETRKQFEEQRPGISGRFTNEELARITLGARSGGMYQQELKDDLSLVSVGPRHFHNMNELFRRSVPFKDEHLQEMPGPQSLWLEAIGAHEGRHSAHTITYGTTPVQRMQSEDNSDIELIGVLIKNGRPDMAQAWIDYRAIAAANPPDPDYPHPIHAVSIFLNDPSLRPPTQQHLDAAKNLRQEMIDAVVAQSGIKKQDAARLRTEDPQKFVQIVQQALDAGKIPAQKLVEVSTDDAKKLIAADMGLTIEQFDQLGPDKIADINKSYDKLKAQGVFTKDETNPFVKLYVEQYVGAIQRRLVPDTSPKVDATAEAKKEGAPTPPAAAPSGTTESAPATPEPTAAEKIAALTDDDHKKNAEDSYEDIALQAVSKHLGISEYAARAMPKEEFITKLDELLKAEKISGTLKMERSRPEMEKIFTEAMNVTLKEAETMDHNKGMIAVEILMRSGAFHQEYENPHLVNRLKAYVDEEQKALKIGPYAEPPAAEPAAKTITPDGTEIVADASTKIEGDVTARGTVKPKLSKAEISELRDMMYANWADSMIPKFDAADRLSYLRSAHQVAQSLQASGVPDVPPALLDPKSIKDQMNALAEKALADIQHAINSNTDKPDVLAKKIEEAKRIAEILHGEGLAKSKEEVLARLGGEDHLKMLLEVANRQNPQTTARGMTAEAPPSPATVKTEGGHYDYVAMLPNLNNGAPQIVAGETNDQITIGGLSASAYFQNQAHPELAEQQIALREAAALSMSTQFAASTTAPKSSQVAVS